LVYGLGDALTRRRRGLLHAGRRRRSWNHLLRLLGLFLLFLLVVVRSLGLLCPSLPGNEDEGTRGQDERDQERQALAATWIDPAGGTGWVA
jgi:hypothetical protein